MEAFEHVVKVYLERRGYVVSTNVKFPVRRRTAKKTVKEFAEHGYEIDVVAARQGSLILGSVKSFFGSVGVAREGFLGLAKKPRAQFLSRYTLFNSDEVWKGVLDGASKKYGYRTNQIERRLFVGKFKPSDEADIRSFLAKKDVQVVGLDEMLHEVLEAAKSKTYSNDPVVMTIKCLQHQGLLPKPPTASKDEKVYEVDNGFKSPALRSSDFRGMTITKPNGEIWQVGPDNETMTHIK